MDIRIAFFIFHQFSFHPPPLTRTLKNSIYAPQANGFVFLHPPRDKPVQRHVPDELSGAKQRQTLVFENISRINHSCANNATFTWFSKDEAAVIRATRPIKAGEEITINYGANGERVQRQRELYQCFHFKCTCERCRTELEAERRSRPSTGQRGRMAEDIAREKAGRWAELEKWLREQHPPPMLQQQSSAQLPPPSRQQVRAPCKGASRPSTPSYLSLAVRSHASTK